MKISSFVRPFCLATTALLITFTTSHVYLKHDLFAPYRSPLPPAPVTLLKHFNEIEAAILKAEKKDLSKRERAIIRGLHWVIRFADKDDHFNIIFPFLVSLLHEMHRNKERIQQSIIADLALKTCFARAQENLSAIFRRDESGRWLLIGILPVLHSYPKYQPRFFEFYREHFASFPATYQQKNGVGFVDAIKKRNYRAMGDYVIDTSFLHHYLAKEKNPKINLPDNLFPNYLKQLEQFEYSQNRQLTDADFIEQSFFATHVIFVLSNYGEIPITNDNNSQRAQKYLDDTWNIIRNRIGYLDLLAEYAQCFKIMQRNKDARIEDAEHLLFDLQRKDGSWGSARDFAADPYNAFHPIWSVLTALNQS